MCLTKPRIMYYDLIFRWFFFPGIKCPVCSKFVPPDDIECHLVMCLTKPRISYNGEFTFSLHRFLSKGQWTYGPTLCLSIDTHIRSIFYRVVYF